MTRDEIMREILDNPPTHCTIGGVSYRLRPPTDAEMAVHAGALGLPPRSPAHYESIETAGGLAALLVIAFGVSPADALAHVEAETRRIAGLLGAADEGDEPHVVDGGAEADSYKHNPGGRRA